MVFKLHSAFALGLIAMVAGTYLLAKMSPEKECCKKFAKIIGWFVVVTAFLGLICITYNGIVYSKDGKMGRGRGMRGKCPMMEKMMMEKQKPGMSE